MKRQDIKVGTQYRARDGSYRDFAIVEIVAERERPKQVWSGLRRYTDGRQKERGFDAKVLRAGGVPFHPEGEIVFVTGRLIHREETVEQHDKALREANEYKKRTDREAEQARQRFRTIIEDLRALGIDAKHSTSGLDAGDTIELETWRMDVPHQVTIEMEHLERVLALAKGASA